MIDLSHYGYTGNSILPEGLMPGRVTAVHRERYELVTSQGIGFGRLKPGIYYGRGEEPFPVTGDFVLVQHVEGGDALISGTLARKSQFIRRDPHPNVGDQVVAANMDYVFIMTSLNRDFNVNRIERYLVLARQSGAAPVVVLTKCDLAKCPQIQIAAAEAVAAGAEVISVSTVTGAGLERLERYLRPGITVVFLGMSGVGKSSLLNALMGSEVMSVGEVREDDSRGRHTTTHRQLFMLKSGAMVIDTPGMRSMGMWEAEEGLSVLFEDVEALIKRCRFSDCRHNGEPDCAVQDAISRGELTQKRWANYQSLRREALYAEDKAAALKAKSERFKTISRLNKRRDNRW